jgi:hypothetical protein
LGSRAESSARRGKPCAEDGEGRPAVAALATIFVFLFPSDPDNAKEPAVAKPQALKA